MSINDVGVMCVHDIGFIIAFMGLMLPRDLGASGIPCTKNKQTNKQVSFLAELARTVWRMSSCHVMTAHTDAYP